MKLHNVTTFDAYSFHVRDRRAERETVVSLKAFYKVMINNFFRKCEMLADKKLNTFSLEETDSTNTFDRGGHLWRGHQILRDKSSLTGENYRKFALWLKH